MPWRCSECLRDISKFAIQSKLERALLPDRASHNNEEAALRRSFLDFQNTMENGELSPLLSSGVE
jgi:hypothetical protein